jgi:phosphoribosylformimino-5-aminoimidazole carboxamide ribotide isomerase
MFSGPNLELAAELAQTTGAEVIVSGGVRDIADLAAAAESGAVGAIVGKALYEGRIELADALARTRPAETS